MKRNPNLIHLSSEHHDGLVIALRIKKALNKLSDFQILVDYIQHLWPTLKHHFSQEEDNFLNHPKLNKEDKLIRRMLDEHQDFEQLIQNIHPNNPNLKADLLAFSTILHDHIRFEERQLFPHIEQILSDVELKLIGDNLEMTHQSLDTNWGVRFWE